MSGRLVTAFLAAGALCCLLAIAIIFSVKAHAQPACGPRAEVVKMLADKYQETARAAGMIRGQFLMEVYTSSKDTWTIVITDPMGKACIAAAGQAWDELPPPPKGKPS
jgi:hypothetical protein